MLSVGEILKKTREKRGYTIAQVEKEIKIRAKFLEDIEANRWQSFSSKIYITGILKNYAKFLGLDQQKIHAFFRRDYERKEDLNFRKQVSPQYLTPTTKRFAFIVLALLCLAFFSYFGYQLKLFLTPPEIAIISPKTNKFRTEQKIRVVGKTEREAVITIFGEKVYQNKEGVFEYDFPLKKGKNELTIEVIGANGKKAVLKKQYVLE